MSTHSEVALLHASSRWHFLRSRSFWISFVLLVFIIGSLSYKFEDAKDAFPWLTAVQLWAYGKMSHAQVRAPRAKWVVGVEVDDNTFFKEMGGTGPESITNRAYLAEIIRRVTEVDPAVIALDINLVREETNGEAGTDDNQNLWLAIKAAQQQRIPVVLTFAFDVKSMHPLNDIFSTRDVPICQPVDTYGPRAGFDHAPADMRKVPLVVTAHDQSSDFECSSFALQIVDAYETVTGIQPNVRQRLRDAIENREFAYTTFLAQCKFQQVAPEYPETTNVDFDPCKGGKPISASDVHDGKSLDRLRHRIVLIGGKRHRWPPESNQSDNDWLDYHDSPEGRMAGMYFHANYVEALLDDRILAPVSRIRATVFDVVLAAIIIFAIEIFGGWQRIGVVLALLAVPIAMSYAMIIYGRCFDWVLPVVLSFAHPAIEKYISIAMDPLGRKHHE